MINKHNNQSKLWQAASLSWLLPGAGQFYLGYTFWGVLFLVTYFALLVSFHYTFGSLLLFLLSVFGATWVLSAMSALLIIKEAYTTVYAKITQYQSPWCAVFLSLIWPGLGHFYLRRWIEGSFFLIFSLVGVYFLPDGRWASFTAIFFRMLVCLSAYARCKSFKKLLQKRTAFILLALFFLMFIINILRPAFTGRFVSFVSTVEGHSMSPTIVPGDYLLVSRIRYLFSPPQIDDIVTIVLPKNFKLIHGIPLDKQRRFFKRIVALEGDTVQLKGGNLYVNGDLREEYPRSNGNTITEINEDERLYYIKDGNLYFHGEKLTQPEDIDQIDIDKLNEIFLEEVGDIRYALRLPYVVPKNSFFVLGDNIDHSFDSRDFGAVTRDKIEGKVISVRQCYGNRHLDR